MNAVETKPSVNGVIKLKRRGRVKFQFDDADQPFEIDVIEVYDQWHEIDWALRESKKDADGRDVSWVIPAAKWNEYCVNRVNFVQGVVNDAYAKISLPAPQLSRAEAEEFIHMLGEEADRLRNFTVPKKVELSSSLENSPETRINFSQ